MSTLEAIHETSNQEYNEKDFEDISARSYRLLKAEHEKCRQEVYDLKRKLELNEAMLREVQDTNELLERSLEDRISQTEKIISETKEKQRVTTEEYENTISDLETKLAKQIVDAQRLHQQIHQQNRTECAQTTNRLANVSLETDSVSFKKRIDRLTVQLYEEKEKYASAEHTIEDLKAQCNQFLHDLRDVQEQLNEKSTALEEARALLESNRTEAAVSLTLNTDPTTDLSKGNSLFAEVEDRRRDMVNKMNALHRKYAEVKRTCALQMAEIRMLKKERATTLGEWENNAGNASAEMEELLQKYKSRVSDLERKLKSEINRNDRSNPENFESATFAYYQSLLFAKKKEIDELRAKIEDLSTHLLVQEETKINISKQLRYSQYQISSLEARVQILQEKLEFSPDGDNANSKTPLKEFQDIARASNNDVTVTETVAVSAQQLCNTVHTLQDKKDNDISVSTETEKNINRNVVVTQTATSRETCKPKCIQSIDEDKNTCPAKTVQFSKNIIFIPTNANT